MKLNPATLFHHYTRFGTLFGLALHMLFPLTRPGEPLPPGSPPSKSLKATPAATNGDAAPSTPSPAAAAAAVDRRTPIAPGDTVIVYESHTSMKAVQVTEEATFGNRFGQFRVKVREERGERGERARYFLKSRSAIS